MLRKIGPNWVNGLGEFRNQIRWVVDRPTGGCDDIDDVYIFDPRDIVMAYLWNHD